METLVSWLLPQQPSSTFFAQSSEFKFFIHDEEHTVTSSDVSPETTLNRYLRQKAHLVGTKNMCLEGGCGSCIVAATIRDPVTDREVVIAVNSCLIPVYSCSGWKIHTIESIGNPEKGYHHIQKALVQFNGTQCGFCSSGMLMNMYALYESGQFTMKDVENSFGGNICRCTGYRPILSAFKSLAVDASTEILGTYPDIEDIPVCKKTQDKCQSKCVRPCGKLRQAHYYDFGVSKWVKVFSVNEILDVFKQFPTATTYMLVGGNTATGVYTRTKEPDIYIDIASVENLHNYTIEENRLVLGANMSLTNAMALFYNVAKKDSKFSYLEKLGDHIDLVANVPVRNTGTLAGNLFTKYEHPEFPSDIYLMLESVAATLSIVASDGSETTTSLVDFLSSNMNFKIIKSITLPALGETFKYDSYKIMPRAQNAHAMVNAGFLLNLTSEGIVESARIVYGGINPSFTHATNAENHLKGKQLFDNATLQGLFQALEAEIAPDHVLPDPTPEFRKKLAIALCYKFILSITPDDKISPRNKSGGVKPVRPVSSGTQDYGTNKSMYPVTQPIPKIEALAQCTGKAQYIMDMPDLPGQLYAAFVLAKAPAYYTISKIDPSEALKLEGVVAYYDKNDIPGDNNFVPNDASPPLFSKEEEIFCDGVVKHYFQPVGMVVAKNQELAEKAADLVQVSYSKIPQKPLMTIRDILAQNAQHKIEQKVKVEPKTKGNDIKHVIKGKFDISWQYHYTMETQCCAVVPVEDGLDIYPSSQFPTLTQYAAAKMLNIPMNKINVSVRRLGGGYGAKITRNSLVSCAAALAAYKLDKPVKLYMPMVTNMNVIGKRYPFSVDYEVGVNDRGSIQYLNASLYSDLGFKGHNEYIPSILREMFGIAYNRDTWGFTLYTAVTNNPSGCSCRAPGTTEAIASVESLMQHIASVIDRDPYQVRLENFDKNKPGVAKYLAELMTWADVEKRKMEAAQFNKVNRWVKRGIEVVPMFYPMDMFGYWNAHVSIYYGDGSVAVAHGGVEMGQGINTKVAQTCAYALGIPLDQVSIKPTNALISPNATNTGGSLTSEAVCYATLRAADILKERMKPIKDKMKNPTWAQLVHQCFLENVDLSASSMFVPTLPDVKPYEIFGATCVEVEVDILTGQHQVKRVDILEDTGDSISPEVDIGQVEGAFIMGMGYWTCEQIVWNDEGKLLTNRTWNYKPPGAKDIPVDFRVKFPKHNPNQVGVLKSKATAEPPLCMSCCVPFAIRSAVASARAEADPQTEKWYPIDGPSTVENTFLNSPHDYKQYTL